LCCISQRRVAAGFDGSREPAQQMKVTGPAQQSLDAALRDIPVEPISEVALALVCHGVEQQDSVAQLQLLIRSAP
jgi:hypothetical protein